MFIVCSAVLMFFFQDIRETNNNTVLRSHGVTDILFGFRF